MWYVYILECANRSLYTGIALDVKKRFDEHKRGRGSAYTRSFGVRKILFTETCATRSEALRREAGIKKMSRKNKLSLIRNKKSSRQT